MLAAEGVRRLVLDVDDLSLPIARDTRAALTANLREAMGRGTPVGVYGPGGQQLALDPAPCGCHASARIWPSEGRPGLWVLSSRRPGMPTTPLIPAGLASRFAVSVAIGAPCPRVLRRGLPVGLLWTAFTWSAGEQLGDWSPVMDVRHLARAVAALDDDAYLELVGPTRTSAVLYGEVGGWGVDYLRGKGQVVATQSVAGADLIAAVREAVGWVVEGGVSGGTLAEFPAGFRRVGPSEQPSRP